MSEQCIHTYSTYRVAQHDHITASREHACQELQSSGLHILASIKQLSSTCHVSFFAAPDTDHQHKFSLTHFIHFSYLSDSLTSTNKIYDSRPIFTLRCSTAEWRINTNPISHKNSVAASEAARAVGKCRMQTNATTASSNGIHSSKRLDSCTAIIPQTYHARQELSKLRAAGYVGCISADSTLGVSAGRIKPRESNTRGRGEPLSEAAKIITSDRVLERGKRNHSMGLGTVRRLTRRIWTNTGTTGPLGVSPALAKNQGQTKERNRGTDA